MQNAHHIRSSVDAPRASAVRRSGLINRFRNGLSRLSWLISRFGVSRHSVLAVSRRLYPSAVTSPLRRLAALVTGASMIGVAVALLVQARLGMSPYDVMVSGLSTVVPLSFGQIVWLTSGALFAIAALLGEYPTRWGIGYVIAVGFAIDAASGLINRPVELWGRLVFVFAALALLGTGISLVVHSGSTGGSFELLMCAGEKRGVPRQWVRTGLELGALLFGISLGGSIGIATVIIAIGIGPLLGLIGQALEDHDAGRQARRAVDASPAPVEHPNVKAAA